MEGASFLEGFVITEADLFKFTFGDNISNTKEEAISNARWLMSRISVNIFRDEYAIFYKVLEWCTEYRFALSRDTLQQLLQNEERTILRLNKVTIDSGNKNEQERYEVKKELFEKQKKWEEASAWINFASGSVSGGVAA